MEFMPPREAYSSIMKHFNEEDPGVFIVKAKTAGDLSTFRCTQIAIVLTI